MSTAVSELLINLNPDQISAVQHVGGPALVVAGPGSGKTRVLTHRVAYLIQNEGIPEINILCVTFTNKAANEVKERVGKVLEGVSKLSWSGTFHSICSKILRKEGYQIGISPSFVIYDSDDQESLIKGIIKDFGIDPKKFSPRAVLSTISSAKSELVDPLQYINYAQGYFQRTVSKIYPEYQKRLRNNSALDFDDLLVETVRLFEEVPFVLDKYQKLFKYILVDEYQDTNKVQYVLTKMLSDSHGNIFVVGDMSQAIYSFRGADFRNILNFQNDYKDAKVYNLGQNYRSTQNILDAAKGVIQNNTTHIPLDLWTENGAGEKLSLYTGYSDKEEANYIVESINNELNTTRTFRDIAVLYRTNAQSRNIEEALIRNNIPYRIVGGQRFYARKEVKDIISYLRVIHNPKDTVSWERIINVPPRGIGQKSAAMLKSTNWDLDFIEERSKIPFKRLIQSKETLSTLELMEEVLDVSGYLTWLNDGSEESVQRIENIKELKSVASQFVSLDEFLENVALIESSNKANTSDVNVVTLLTVHASKGLEFPVVFIVGMEEGLFPHVQSMGELDQLEEERRLCYVAITRAKERVFITNATSRLYFGTTQSNPPSRFIDEIPKVLIERLGTNKSSSLSGNYFKSKFSDTRSDEAFLDDMDLDRNHFTWE